MLVLSRRIGESFVIGDGMEVTVVDITGEKVVLGVAAPKTVAIARLDAPTDGEAGTKAINQRGYGRQYQKHSESEK